MASLYDSASLVMIPSGVKEDKLYSIKPTDGSGDFTFSRDADIEATRVNSSGLIEKAKVNLALQSNTFSDGVWPLQSATITGGQSGYDGTSDAWLLNSSASGGNIRQGSSVSGVHTFSIYAKKGTADGIRVRFDQTTDTNVFIDLTDGSVYTSENTIDINIENVSGGWYRVTFAMLNAGMALFRIYPTDGTTNSIAGTIYIQDAALCHGLIAQDYVETTTTAVVEGLTADLPRLDYSGGASCPSLLLEPSRTNGVLQSEYFGSGWLLSNATITSNDTTSPEGVINAAKIVEDSSTANHYIAEDVTTTSGVAYTMSFFAKKGENRYLRASRAGGSVAVGFDLENGDFVEGGGAIGDTQDFGNGWYRCIMTFNTNTTTTQIRIELSNALSATNTTYLGDGTSGVYAYGAQLELGSYPTSYIPTYGTAANRGAELATTATNTLGGLNVGTFFIEMERNGIDTGETGSALSLRNNSGAEEIRLHFDAPTSQVRWRDGNNSFAQIGNALAVTAETTFKILVKTDGTTIKAFGNGAQLGSDYSAVSPYDLQRIYLNGLGWTDKQTLFFPTALTDAECIALTTI